MGDHKLPNIADDDQPIALRRKRRSSIARNSDPTYSAQKPVQRLRTMPTPPVTPKRAKKRVRFSNIGPEIALEPVSSGLTPFIRRTSLTAPINWRRSSTTSPVSSRASYNHASICGTQQFAPLRQVLEGRVKRRLKRHRLSEEVNTIEYEKKRETKQRRLEIKSLSMQLAAKDIEIQKMRDEHRIASQIREDSVGAVVASTNLTNRVQGLEQEIRVLRAELKRQESNYIADPDWTTAAKDPFNSDHDKDADADDDNNDDDEDIDDHTVTDYDDGFTMLDTEIITTPRRLKTSFPSPPATMPNTPCKANSPMNAGVQVILPIADAEKELLKAQLQSLQSEISKLISSIAFSEDYKNRLWSKLSDFIPVEDTHDYTSLNSALDTVLTKLTIAQSQASEQSTAFSTLSNQISNIGFPASSPEEVVNIIATQFRQARLELEYLAPGEFIEGFENSKILEMLVTRLKVLAKKAKRQDDSIDQYHEQEVLLRQQINSRVSAMDEMRRNLVLANTVVGDLHEQIHDRDVGNDRLAEALDGYREEVKGLEQLIERVEREAQITEENLRSEVLDLEQRLTNETLAHDLTRADNEGKDMLLTELERRLTAALQSSLDLQNQIAALVISHAATLAEKDTAINAFKDAAKSQIQDHSAVLALRDARVIELSGEIERINEALKSAHTMVQELKEENSKLIAQLKDEMSRGGLVIEMVQEHLRQALQTSTSYVNGGAAFANPCDSTEGILTVTIAPQKDFLDLGQGKRSSACGKKRRYDSGLGFLEEAAETSEHIGNNEV